MNIYDFDGTIYEGDSSVDFYWYALKKAPHILRFLPKQLLGFIRYARKQIDKTALKSHFFCFLSAIDSEQLAISFWKKRQNKIAAWYRQQQAPDDIVISASPEFLLRPICDTLGIQHLIASLVNPKTGILDGENCYGTQKVCRLYAAYGSVRIDGFYSDSLSDAPLAKLAEHAYFVKNGTLTHWPC